MTQAPVKMTVRKVSDRASIVDIEGDVTAACEDALMEAYANATTDKTRAIVLNFNRLEYMNSGGIGLLVTLLSGQTGSGSACSPSGSTSTIGRSSS